MSAARRKGKWVGGCPVLGYDVDPGGGRLVVNEEEAERVRAIFALFEETWFGPADAGGDRAAGLAAQELDAQEGSVPRGRPVCAEFAAAAVDQHSVYRRGPA